MIHFDRVPEPPDYDLQARRPGFQWLEQHPGAKRPHDYWSAFKPALADGFRNLCAYSAMYEPVGTVDHFTSWYRDTSLAYEWSNLRYASAWINSSKHTADNILDPHDVEDGWFKILLPSLQLQVTDRVPKELRDKAEDTLRRLHLVDDERVMRQRTVWYEMYLKGQLDLDGLRKMAPLIARAIEDASA